MTLFKKCVALFCKMVAAFAVTYMVLVLGYVWWHCYKSPFQDGSNGKLDAYRHTFASAVVTYTTSPKVVRLVTVLMERKNRAANLMDQHNNAIGIHIGAHVKTLDEIDPLVVAQIENGTVNATDKMQTTWLPPQYWSHGFFW